MDDILKYYEVLGLKPGATEEQIKQAYRDLAKVWHPDRFTGNPRLQEKAQEKLKEINLAYEYLKSHQYTPPPEQEPYDFGGEEYRHEETPPQEKKAERKEQTTTYTPAYKPDSFFSRIPKWVMVVIALALIRALYSYINAPPKQQETQYKPPLYYPVPSKPLLPPIDSPPTIEKPKLQEPITKPLIKPFPPKTAKSPPPPARQLQKPSTKALDAPLKEEPLKETTDTSQLSKEDLKFAAVKEQIKRVDRELEGIKKALTQSSDKVATIPPPQPTTAGKYFTFGSSKEEVLAVQGTPTSIVGETWYYRYSTVSFYDGKVRGYSDTSKNLHVKMAPQAGLESRRPGDYFTLGSTKDDVLAVQGTPASIVGETWYYGYSTISFYSGRVRGYSNTSRNLRVIVLPTTESSASLKGHFTIGSTHDEVLAVQGTPSSIVGETWYYNYSTVSFSNGRVRGYSNTSHNLKVKLE